LGITSDSKIDCWLYGGRRVGRARGVEREREERNERERIKE